MLQDRLIHNQEDLRPIVHLHLPGHQARIGRAHQAAHPAVTAPAVRAAPPAVTAGHPALTEDPGLPVP